MRKAFGLKKDALKDKLLDATSLAWMLQISVDERERKTVVHAIAGFPLPQASELKFLIQKALRVFLTNLCSVLPRPR